MELVFFFHVQFVYYLWCRSSLVLGAKLKNTISLKTLIFTAWSFKTNCSKCKVNTCSHLSGHLSYSQECCLSTIFFWEGGVGGFWRLIPIIYQTIDRFHNGNRIQLSFVSILISLSKHAAMGSKVMQVGLINLSKKGITNRPPFMKLVQ